MKHVKRIVGFVLALVMVLALSAGVFAANGYNDNSGMITINNAVSGQTYTIYQILTLESYNEEAKAYSYKATSEWDAFVKSADILDVYLSIDGSGYVTWQGETTDSRVAAFAKLAQAYAVDSANNVTATKTEVAASETVTFTGLNLGYYLLDSSLGTLCSLDTTNPTVTIQEKNKVPTNEKTVEEDSTGAYGKVNDADIGQTVNFKSTVTAQAGAENYVFHDTMSSGLTYTDVTSVKLGDADVDAKNYTVVTDPTDGCTFEIRFDQSFCNTLKADDKIVISYTATVNEKAVIGNAGNPNESKLEYGQSGKTTTTPPSTTTTYTWDMDVLKYANLDESKRLENAQFVLLNKDKSKVATFADGKLTGWETVPEAGTDGEIALPAGSVLTTNAQGEISVAGLDSDTYYLREVQAPAGYNKLADDVKIEITRMINDEKNAMTYEKYTAKVNNNSGAELPSTGGMGTTVFYVLGSALVLGAAVVLVTRKRMKEHN